MAQTFNGTFPGLGVTDSNRMKCLPQLAGATDIPCPSQLDPAVVWNVPPSSHFFFCRTFVIHDAYLIHILLQLFTFLFRLLSGTEIHKAVMVEDYMRKSSFKIITAFVVILVMEVNLESSACMEDASSISSSELWILHLCQAHETKTPQ